MNYSLLIIQNCSPIINHYDQALPSPNHDMLNHCHCHPSATTTSSLTSRLGLGIRGLRQGGVEGGHHRQGQGGNIQDPWERWVAALQWCPWVNVAKGSRLTTTETSPPGESQHPKIPPAIASINEDSSINNHNSWVNWVNMFNQQPWLFWKTDDHESTDWAMVDSLVQPLLVAQTVPLLRGGAGSHGS